MGSSLGGVGGVGTTCSDQLARLARSDSPPNAGWLPVGCGRLIKSAAAASTAASPCCATVCPPTIFPRRLQRNNFQTTSPRLVHGPNGDQVASAGQLQSHVSAAIASSRVFSAVARRNRSSVAALAQPLGKSEAGPPVLVDSTSNLFESVFSFDRFESLSTGDSCEPAAFYTHATAPLKSPRHVC